MSDSAPASQDMLLGEMRGQLRELVHSVNNLSMNMTALSREVIGLGPLAADIVDIKGRLLAIEKIEQQRVGANGLAAVILKSPALGWLVGAAITAWAILTGKVSI